MEDGEAKVLQQHNSSKGGRYNGSLSGLTVRKAAENLSRKETMLIRRRTSCRIPHVQLPV